VRVLVTGGAGFIGSNFIRHLLNSRRDLHVTNLDKITYAGNPENLADVQNDSRYQFVHGDIADPSSVEALLPNGVDVLVNFAAETHVDRSILDALPFMYTNVLGLHCLLETARKNNISRFVHISSDEVYGPAKTGESHVETSPLIPSSPYAASKAAGDHLVGAYAHTYGMRPLVLRSTNNYGPNQFPEKFIPLMIANALDKKPLPLFGDGAQERDWLHVEDFCRAVAAAVEAEELSGVYNVSADDSRTNLEIAGEIAELAGAPPSLITHVQDRPGHDRRYAIDSSKFREATGWTPEIAFAEGLRDTVKWYQLNSVWLEKTRSGEYRRYYELHYGRRMQTFAF